MLSPEKLGHYIYQGDINESCNNNAADETAA